MKHQKRNYSLLTPIPRIKANTLQENRSFQEAKHLIDKLNKQQAAALHLIQSSAGNA